MKQWFLAAAIVCGFAGSAHAATIKVCASGCDYTNANLQTALDAAAPGDTILLQEVFTYVGVFILPNQKSCPAQDATCYITLKTGVNSTGVVQAASRYPSANIRVTPATATNYAKFQSNVNNFASIRTTYPGEIRTNCATQPCITAFWKLQFLEVFPNSYAGGPLVILGVNDLAVNLPNNNAQNTRAKVPHHFQLVQLYVHGDPVKGVSRGIELHADWVTVQDSYVSDIKEIGRDVQALTYVNGSGQLTVTNNYLEAATEVFISGGGDPSIKQNAVTVTTPTSASTFTLSTVTDLIVGQGMMIQVGGAGHVQRGIASSIVGNVVTLASPLTAAPDSPGLVKWSIVPKNGTFTKNVFTKQPTWRQPIVATPQGLGTSTATSGGTIAAGTVSVRVIAKFPTAEAVVAQSTPSAEVTQATTGSTSTVTATWTAVPNATYYHVYFGSAGGENYRVYTTSTSATYAGAASIGNCGDSSNHNTSHDTDTGCTVAVPTNTGDVWAVKNAFEFKVWDTALVQGNVFDYSWVNGQVGFLVLFTVANQDGDGVSSTVANITFRDNKLRHGGGGFQITASSSFGSSASSNPAQIAHDIFIINNSLEDLSATTYGGGSMQVVTITGGFAPEVAAIANFTYDHNTAFMDSGSAFLTTNFYGPPQKTAANFTWKNSMQPKLFYGMRTYDAGGLEGEGTISWNIFTSGSPVFTRNVLADANCAAYPDPTNNFCPTSVNWQNEFVDYANGNYRLKATSPYHNAALDGTDIGANYDTIEALTNIALSGNNSGTPPPPQPTITTTSLAQGQLGVAYSQPLTVTSGTAPYAWTVTGLPAGLSLTATTGATITIVGTPTGTAGTATVTINVLDSNSQLATKTLALTVIQGVFPEPRPSKYGPNHRIFLAQPICPDGTLDQIYVGDQCYDLTTNQMKCAATTSPTVTWSQTCFPAASGGVSSVGLALPGELTVTNSPVTTSGTLTGAWASQTQNKVLASPNGSSGTPTFRPLVAADLPSTGTAVVLGGQVFGSSQNIGSTDNNDVKIIRNNNVVGSFTSGQESWFSDASGNMDWQINAGGFTADSYSLGASTTNGNKGFLTSLTGTRRQAMTFADAGVDTDYIWGISASGDSGATYKPMLRVRQDGAVSTPQGPLYFAATAPTISAGFGTSPAILSSNGTATFRVNVGTGGTATTGTIGMPAAANGHNCLVSDFTSNIVTRQTGGSTTTVVVTAASAWGASDTLIFICHAY